MLNKYDEITNARNIFFSRQPHQSCVQLIHFRAISFYGSKRKKPGPFLISYSEHKSWVTALGKTPLCNQENHHINTVDMHSMHTTDMTIRYLPYLHFTAPQRRSVVTPSGYRREPSFLTSEKPAAVLRLKTTFFNSVQTKQVTLRW